MPLAHRPSVGPTDGRRGWRLPALMAIVALTLAAVCAETVTPGAGGGPTPRGAVVGAPFEELFDAWVPGRWSRGDHELGRGRVDSLNVTVRDGVLEISTPPGTHAGGEIVSRAEYGHGAYAASMRCGTPAGTICAFFLYQASDDGRNDEIDMEVLGGTRELWLTAWVGGLQTNHARVDLGFDPAAGLHTYAMEHRRGTVSFRVDGVFVRRFTRGLPERAMRLMANAWWPTWQDGSSGGGKLFIDSIRAEP